jgi:hypothetical protein
MWDARVCALTSRAVGSAARSATRLTPEGFQFLLLGARAQLWSLLQHYMGGGGDGGTADAPPADGDDAVDRSDVLNLLFLLGSLRCSTVRPRERPR